MISDTEKENALDFDSDNDEKYNVAFSKQEHISNLSLRQLIRQLAQMKFIAGF